MQAVTLVGHWILPKCRVVNSSMDSSCRLRALTPPSRPLSNLHLPRQLNRSVSHKARTLIGKLFISLFQKIKRGRDAFAKSSSSRIPISLATLSNLGVGWNELAPSSQRNPSSVMCKYSAIRRHKIPYREREGVYTREKSEYGTPAKNHRCAMLCPTKLNYIVLPLTLFCIHTTTHFRCFFCQYHSKPLFVQIKGRSGAAQSCPHNHHIHSLGNIRRRRRRINSTRWRGRRERDRLYCSLLYAVEWSQVGQRARGEWWWKELQLLQCTTWTRKELHRHAAAPLQQPDQKGEDDLHRDFSVQNETCSLRKPADGNKSEACWSQSLSKIRPLHGIC